MDRNTGDMAAILENIGNDNASPGPQPGVPRLGAALTAAQCDVLAGAVRRALAPLLQLAGEVESDEGIEDIEAVCWLASSYALLGHSDDASEWCARLQRLGKRLPHVANAGLALHVALAHLQGDDVAAVRLANQVLAETGATGSPLAWRFAVTVLGFAYLRMAQVAKAERCVQALRERVPQGADLASGLAQLLYAEVDLWAVVRQFPRFASHFLFVDSLHSSAPTAQVLAGRALRSYEEIVKAQPQSDLLTELAGAGAARARLIVRDNRADWQILERQLHWMGERGLAYGRERARLHLGIWSLMKGDAIRARNALLSLALAAMRRSGSRFEHDALYYASLACADCGDTQYAFAFLNEYTTRIRAQHLSRVTLPPPNLDGAAGLLADPAERLRGAELDDGLVMRVTALVRSAPAELLHSQRLASVLGVSRRTVQYRVRRATGKSPKELITAIRVAHARDLLDDGKAGCRVDIEQVARTSGFNNYRSFVRAFRGVYGVSPLEFVSGAQSSNSLARTS